MGGMITEFIDSGSNQDDSPDDTSWRTTVVPEYAGKIMCVDEADDPADDAFDPEFSQRFISLERAVISCKQNVGNFKDATGEWYVDRYLDEEDDGERVEEGLDEQVWQRQEQRLWQREAEYQQRLKQQQQHHHPSAPAQ